MKALLLAILFALPNVAHAADERARRDINGNPSLIAVSTGTGEIVKIKANADGSLVVVSSGINSVLVINGAGAAAVNVQDGGNSLTVDATQLDIDDLTFASDKVDASGSTLGANSGVDIGDVTINNAGAGAAVNIQDGGNVISVDDNGTTLSIDDGGGTITVDATDLDIRDLLFASDSVDATGSTISVVNVEGTSLSIDDGGNIITVDGTVAATQSGTWILGANSGIDIGDVTINNASGASAVNVQDGGNSLTVDDGGSSLTVDAVQLDIDDLTFASDKVDVSGSILGANSGVDIGDVTINNASGASSVNIQDGGNTITVDGTVTANAGTGIFDTTGSTISVVNVEGQTLAVDDGGSTLSVDDGGSSLTIDAVSLPLPNGAATSALQTSGNSSLSSLDTKAPSQGQAAMAASVPVAIASDQSSLTVDDGGGSLTIDASALPLPAGAATSANQTTANSSLSTIAGDTTSLDAKVPSQGAATTANSTPVNIASDQTVPISASSLPLPSGAATAANQATGNGSLATIAGDTTSLDAKVPSQGAATTANSTPVNIASDQTVPISATSLPLPSGAATSANQTTANSSLSTIAGDTTSIDGKTPSLGQAAMAASVPIAIASDQSDVPTVANVSGNDTPSESFTNITTVAEVMATSASRESSTICNEGPEVARCGSGSVTTTLGQRLLVDQCYSWDGPEKPFRGAISCVSVGGPSTKITATESN